MLCLELTNELRMDFESIEALERAIRSTRDRVPLVIRDEHEGSCEIVWAPGDQD